MKFRTLFAFLLAVVAGLQQTKAQEAYACRTPNTLTFYYDNLRSSRAATYDTFDIPADGSEPGWYQDVIKAYNLHNIVFNPSFASVRPTNTSRWFKDLVNLSSITGIVYLNTSAVTNMSYMFEDCLSLTSLDLSGFNTANVTNMSRMFYGCEALTSLSLSNFNTAKVTDMSSMFYGCEALTSLSLSNFNTAKVTDMSRMFYGCKALTSLNISSFNTAKVYNMMFMFNDCSNLKTIYVNDDWSTDGIPYNSNLGSYMFTNCTSLVGGMGTTYNANYTDYSRARIDGGSSRPGYFTAFTEPEAYACYTPSNTTLTFYHDRRRSSRSGTTYDMNTGTNQPGWLNDGTNNSVTRVVFDSSFADVCPTTTCSWFYNMTTPQTITGIEYLNTSEVTNMSYMFYGCEALTSLFLNNFNTAKVTNMSYMFYGCKALTSLDLGSFNSAKVTNMKMMFYNCPYLKTISVSEYWSTTAVTTSNSMFAYCTSLVGGAGTTYDENHVDASYARIDGGSSRPGYFTAFIAPKAYACYKSSNTTLTFYFDNQFKTRTGKIYDLNKGTNLPGWVTDNTYASVSRVVFDSSFTNARPTTTCCWFYGMTKPQTITGIENLNTSAVTNMYGMFGSCKALTSLDVSHFNTTKVTDMTSMFQNCEKLTTLDLSNFNTSKVTNMQAMFMYCNVLKAIYVGNKWSTNNVTSSSYMFKDCTSLVGSKGTKYNANHVDASYAHIDGGTDNPGYLSPRRGDVNVDGVVDIADVTYVLAIMANNGYETTADVNRDNVVDIADVTNILTIMAEL